MALHLDHIRAKAGSLDLQANLRVEHAQRVAVVGASGAGKSTLLDVIAGFIAPYEGDITWQGKSLIGFDPSKRPVGILFQDTNLFPHLTIQQNLALALNPQTGRTTKEQDQRIESVLARVGLSGFTGRRLSEMSGGQQSRAALARVLVQARPVLLLDEPFAALGPALKEEMLDLVAETAAADGATVLLVTHDPNDARRFAPHTIVVEEGRANPPQPTGELLDNPPEGLRAYLGKGPSRA